MKIPRRFSLRMWDFQFDIHYNQSLGQLHFAAGKRYFYTSTVDERGVTNGYKTFEIKWY